MTELTRNAGKPASSAPPSIGHCALELFRILPRYSNDHPLALRAALLRPASHFAPAQERPSPNFRCRPVRPNRVGPEDRNAGASLGAASTDHARLSLCSAALFDQGLAGSAPRTSFAGRTSHGAKTRHALRPNPDPPIRAGHRRHTQLTFESGKLALRCSMNANSRASMSGSSSGACWRSWSNARQASRIRT